MTNSINSLENEFVQYSSSLGKEILYKPSLEVKNILDPNIQEILQKMRIQLNGKGIGLAANQIGFPLQIFMIEFNNENERYKHLNFESIPNQVYINPRIVNTSKERVSFWHGCLSAIGKPRGLVATYKWLDFEAFDENGNFKSGRLDGIGSVIFQHEFRHLLGSCYFDHAKEFLEYEKLNNLFLSGVLNPYEIVSEEVPLLLADYIVGTKIS
ncbi:peptide deformylase [Pigmentibacter sp. JX0631]|uniref:peptide deformylase n=1 Tax=Pigmentibacter sp. JX0631 TaxID=2976982 RepID=UPI002469B5F8|nr:peptide deformylase [Pigmentibacter sp. JX0631]WGL59797.1 peptide deformylase [Pigmentibacter sp. JX0631]